MRVVHHTLKNGSGLNRVATNMAFAERKMGLDSVLSYTNEPLLEVPAAAQDAVPVVAVKDALISDVHVIHSHLPDGVSGKTVFVAHGTPEHCFNMAIEQAKGQGYAAGDPWMLSKYRIDTSDATVTFWPRHAYIWKSLNRKAAVHCIDMGIDTDFWTPRPTQGKWVGKPSLFSCENAHAIKWPLDLILMFPMIMEAMKEAVLHLHYIPLDQHRWWYPLMQANGTCYKSFSSGNYFDPPTLRNAFCSVDFYMSMVRYGDFNSVCLEAAASGAKVISFRGNPYAHYWLTEGCQISQAQELLDILSGKVTPREIQKIASLGQMASSMKDIYESI